MFENVGHTLDEDAGKRRAASAVLLTALSGGVVATAFVVAAWTAQTIATTPPPPEQDLYEVVLDDSIDEPLPEVPAPPPPALARGEQPDPDAVEPQPDEMVTPQDDLDKPPPIAVADAQPLSGSPDGVDGGEPDGDPNGVPGGVPGGTGTQLGADYAVPTVHRSEVRIKVPQTPAYPDAARDMNLGEVDCRVSILISEDGRPEDQHFEACPAVFHASIIEAVSRMRWYPYKVGGQRSKARFVIRFRFQPGR